MAGDMSLHFSTWECLFTVHRPLIQAQRDYWESDSLVRANALHLALYVLEPIRSYWGPVVVHSWVRCPELNVVVDGAQAGVKGAIHDSQHIDGAAADIHIINGTLDQLFAWIAGSTLPYSQVIREPIGAADAGWVHVGLQSPGRPVHEVLR